MSGEINAYQIPLLVQPVEITPTFCLRNFGSGYVHYIFSAEQGVDRCRLICLITVAIAYQCLNKDFILGIDGKILFALQLRETVKTTGKGKAFQVLLVAGIQIDALHKIENTGIRPVLRTLFHDTLHSTLTYSFHRTQSETDITFGVHGKLQVRFVHIGAKHFDAHRLTFVHEFGYRRYIGQTSAHYGSHVLCRIIGFQERRLIGNP